MLHQVQLPVQQLKGEKVVQISSTTATAAAANVLVASAAVQQQPVRLIGANLQRQAALLGSVPAFGQFEVGVRGGEGDRIRGVRVLAGALRVQRVLITAVEVDQTVASAGAMISRVTLMSRGCCW